MEEFQKILDWYMEKINEWVGKEYNSKKGVYSYLSEDLLVRKIVVSPNVKSGLEGLYTFLATEVLGIHRNKASKVSYQIIKRYLAGEELKKKYHFNFELLPKTLDKEANKEAYLKESARLQEIRMKAGESYYQKEIEQCDEWLPYILMDELRKVLWTTANKYYNVCTESFCEGCNKKKQLYFQFTQAAAIFEMFYVEFIQTPLREHIQRGTDLLKTFDEEFKVAKYDIEKFRIEPGKTKEIEGILHYITDWGQHVALRTEEVAKEINTAGVFAVLEAEFARDVCAMFHLLLVFETINVHQEERVDMIKFIKMETEFTWKYGKCFDTFVRTNEEKSVCYRRVNEHLEMIWSQYTDEDYDIVQYVIGFLEQLRKKIEKEDAPLYEKYLTLLALPIYRSLGGQ